MLHIIQLLLLTATLLGCSLDSDQPDKPATPPLISAAEQGDLATLKQLLQTQPADTYDSCQWTPLMKASLNGHQEIATELLASRASIDLADKGGYTALMLAASNNHYTLVRLLLQNRADINRQERTQGWTALIWSAKRGHLETVKELLSVGANTEIKDNSGLTAQEWAVKNKHIEIANLLTDGKKILHPQVEYPVQSN